MDGSAVGQPGGEPEIWAPDTYNLLDAARASAITWIKGCTVAMFVSLSKLTDQGAKNIQDLPGFVEENMARAERLGLKIHGWYLTQGQYDVVVIVEAPDAEAMLASAAGLAGSGNFRTETLRAFTLDDIKQVLQKGGSA